MTRIEKHEQAIQILENISHHERSIQYYNERIVASRRLYQSSLTDIWRRGIVIQEMCIGRWEQRYNKLF
jgi:hypothetical protein